MDSKNLKDGRLADLALKSYFFAAQVKDIPGAAIDGSDNVTIDLSKFDEGASVVLARIGSELASISTVDETATLDFASAATETSVLELAVAIEL